MVKSADTELEKVDQIKGAQSLEGRGRGDRFKAKDVCHELEVGKAGV